MTIDNKKPDKKMKNPIVSMLVKNKIVEIINNIIEKILIRINGILKNSINNINGIKIFFIKNNKGKK
ncbi:MAG: hypothetical protein CL764_06580 [Chloroflexi bacterium]|nr:hypothetical protein [Chloroflexota bacterium]|tara:strand:+ start:144 stop:344 length:201 start_codon:yes stop_codon:yes gene_type:complete